MPTSSIRVCHCLLVMLSVVSAQAVEVDFARDIEPIFKEHCLKCHGERKPKSNFRIDQRISLLRGGDAGLAAVVPGKPDKSYLVELLKESDPTHRMPHDADPLPAKQIKLIEQWIASGAKQPGQDDVTIIPGPTSDHWSLQPVKRPGVPIKSTNPVDAFLLAKLKERGLSPNAPADARSLIRRVSIVLTGLPPTPERVHQFEQAFTTNADTAYAELVEELLESPHFGERWAQHWLDVIRWAETNGSEANLYRKNAWIYRDYVVRAFNEDKPYDQFIREQIAGDSIGSGEATGFLVAGPHVPAATVGREPAAIRQARADRMDEVMQTIGASMMGVTISCARCHNHKFDPFTITDYYAMTAVFQDVEFGSRYPEFSMDHPRRQQGRSIWQEISKSRRTLRESGPWIEDWGAFREAHFAPAETKALRILFQSPSVGLDEIQVFGPDSRDNLAHRGAGTKVSGFPEKGNDNRNPIDRVNDGNFGTMAWRANVGKSKEKPWVRFDFAESQKVHRVQLSSNREYFWDTDYLTTKPRLAFREFQVDILDAQGNWKPMAGSWWIQNKLNPGNPARMAAIQAISESIRQLAEEGPRPSFIGRFIRPQVTRVLHRGSPESPRDEVMPAAPVIMNGDLGLTPKAAGKQRRAKFADWISNKDNPLTARVMVNRIWHHIFGKGIVTTTSDFGISGAMPTHPELLDWLAAEFMNPKLTEAKPWSMKAVIRLLVTSDAFRRSNLPATQGLSLDAGSTLLWRFPPRRVEAEVIRDGILQASNTLDRTIGGRGYRIHNVKKTYAQWEVVNNHAQHTWRRMLYQERMRRVDDQIFTAFDFPDCGQIRDKRPVSTTPLQALNLMNSPFVVDQAKRIADRAKQEAGTDNTDAVIKRCFQLLLTRDPDEVELTACRQAADEAGLTFVCRSLLNSNEFAFLP